MLDVRIEHDEALEVFLSGELRFEGMVEFQRIVRAVETFHGHKVVLHLAEMDVSDPAGIGMLLVLNDAVRRRSMSLTINGISSETRRVFDWCPMIAIGPKGEMKSSVEPGCTCEAAACRPQTGQSRSGPERD